MRHRGTQTLLNYALYQLGWLACVMAAGAGRPWLGAAAAGLLIAAHLVLTNRPGAEALLLAAAGILGLVLDGALTAAGVLRYAGEPLVPFLAPLWAAVLWIQLATLLHYALAWLAGRYWTGALLAAAGAPLAFLAGQRLGAVDLPRGALSLATLAVAWAAAVPALLYLSDRLGPPTTFHYRLRRPPP